MSRRMGAAASLMAASTPAAACGHSPASSALTPSTWGAEEMGMQRGAAVVKGARGHQPEAARLERECSMHKQPVQRSKGCALGRSGFSSAKQA